MNACTRKSWLVFVLFAATAGGCAAPESSVVIHPPPRAKKSQDTVRAERYRIFWAKSMMDAIHGGGGWVEELYFPDLHVACDLRMEWPSPEDMVSKGQLNTSPILDAFPASGPRNELTGLHGGPPSKIEDIRVPKALAEEISALSAEGVRLQKEKRRLGAAVEKAGVLKVKLGRKAATATSQGP